jgi:hypothetical protein
MFDMLTSALAVVTGALAQTCCPGAQQSLSRCVVCILDWLNDWAHNWRPESLHDPTMIGMHQTKYQIEKIARPHWSVSVSAILGKPACVKVL